MSAAPAPTLDFQDIQGVVLNGYGHLNYSRFVLLRTIDAQSARRWLTHIANEISRPNAAAAKMNFPALKTTSYSPAAVWRSSGCLATR
jgi:hypothetical protein